MSSTLAWAASNPAGGQIIRLAELARSDRFRLQKIDFTAAIARELAEISTSLLGLTHQTPAPMYKDLVADFCESWGVAPTTGKKAEEWRDIAAEFAHLIVRKSASAVSISTQGLLKAAFMNGVKFGMAGRNAAHKPERFVRIEKRSRAVVSILVEIESKRFGDMC